MGSIGTANGGRDLPKRDSLDLHLVVATPEEHLAQTHANSTEWRGPLNLETYLRREYHLFNQDLTKDGGLTAWMLVYQPEGQKERQVLCGCETIKKKALVGKNGKVEDVTVHGICSVFCPEEFRGKGYAGRMMKDLGERLESWQVDAGKSVPFTVLFSDIGKEFYTARGWHPFPSTHVSLPPVTPAMGAGLPQVHMLKAENLPELCTDDEKLVRSRVSKFREGDKTAVALIPESKVIQWHQAREDFVANELYGKQPEIKGAVSGDAGTRVWCYWTRIWTNPQEHDRNTLHILRLVIEDESFSDFAPASTDSATELQDSPITMAVAALFAAAQAEAARWDMKEVQIWNPTSTTLAAAQILDPKASVVDRESESIVSLRWYGEGSHEDVELMCNEKVNWC